MHERTLVPLPVRDHRITYSELVAGIAKNREYFLSPDAVADTINYGKYVGEILLRNIPEAMVVFGDGFPYYVARIDNTPAPIQEIGRFQEEQVPFYAGKVVDTTVLEPGQ